eukprot:Em0003g1351a
MQENVSGGKLPSSCWRHRPLNQFINVLVVVCCDHCIDGRNGPAVVFCCTCRQFLCKHCEDHHRSGRQLSKHDIVGLDQEGAKHLLAIMKPREYYCTQPNHEENKIHSYCQTCQCLIHVCGDGVPVAHKDHNITELSTIAKNHRDSIQKVLANARETVARVTGAIDANNKVREHVMLSKMKAHEAIDQAFETLQQALELRKTTLLSELESISLSKTTSLTLQKEMFEKLIEEISYYTEMAVHSLQTHTDHEIVALGGLIPTELSAVLKKVEPISLIPITPNGISAVVQTDDLIIPLSKFGCISDLSPTPSSSTWTSTSVAKVKTDFHVKVESKTSKGTLYPHGGLQMKAEMRSNTGAVVHGEMEDHGDGTYTTTLIPQTAGPHQLLITLNGQHVQNSPHDLYVLHTYDYKTLGHAQQVIRCRSGPYCVAIHDNGDLYVGAWEDCIYVFDTTGHLKKIIGSPGQAFGSNTIKVFTKEGVYIRKYGDLKGPLGIAIDSEVNAHCEDVGGDGKVTVESFTQPSTFDEIVLGTQIPCTPGASQPVNAHCEGVGGDGKVTVESFTQPSTFDEIVLDVLKISDFGLSTVFRHMGEERKLNRKCGTPTYVAPEVFEGVEYFVEPADVWSCGIVLVALLAGELPWDTPTSDCAEYREWCYQNYFFSPWTKISNEPLVNAHCEDVGGDGKVTVESFTQPSTFDEIVLGTQIPCTPGASQPVNAHCEGVGGDGKVTVESFTQPSTFDEIVLDVLKISDFGLSTVFRHMGEERKLNRKCGTPTYVAPEVFEGVEYFVEPADVWSCGIVLVALLAGELPWDTPTSDCAEYREWCYQNYFFSPWTKISNEPLALLKKILRQAPSKRHTLESIKKHLWYRKSYPVVTQSPSQEALSLVSPSCQHTRRVKVESSPRYGDRPGSDVVSSQPVNAHCEDVGGDGKVTVESFTQPSTFDEIVLSTQIPCTPGASQSLFQRLTLRMTRFYTNLASAKVWSRLNQIMKSLAFETRTSMDQASLMISTMDRRKQPLSFKVSIYELKSDLLLVEFRRSKGDGIEFKKMFRQIRQLCEDMVCKPPSIT